MKIKRRKTIERKWDKEVRKRLETIEYMIEGHRILLSETGLFDYWAAKKMSVNKTKGKK